MLTAVWDNSLFQIKRLISHMKVVIQTNLQIYIRQIYRDGGNA